jgi:hypothetical protein
MLDRERLNFAHGLPRAEAIAQLNDKLRTTGMGGRILITRGVCALPGFDQRALLNSLAKYDGFDVDNDPHGERDFGDLALFGTTLLWKLDYYDRQLTFASADPADEGVTVRVLTVMLESEY